MTLPRKRQEIRPKEKQRDRWLVSYSDFITLLFAFFVVMYAISSVNEGKYKALSNSLNFAFSQPEDRYSPYKGIPLELVYYRNKEFSLFRSDPNVAPMNPLKPLSQLVRQTLAPMLENDLVKIRESQDWIEIELRSTLLFKSASADLAPTANSLIAPIVGLLKKTENPVQVEGFTDNLPISNEIFESNWELSTLRAASVVRRMIEIGVPSQRLAAVGYGSNYPIADNTTAKGRSENRRVLVLISKQDERSRLAQRIYKAPIIAQEQIKKPETVKVNLPVSDTPLNIKAEHLPGGGVRFSTHERNLSN